MAGFEVSTEGGGVTAARFLDLFLAFGGDCYLRHDGRVVLRGPRVLIDAVTPKVKQIGRDAFVAELRDQNRASAARLATLLGRFDGPAPSRSVA
jgi:hypothetical protein